LDHRLARRLFWVWFVSVVILTLAPFTLRATPRAWSGLSRLGALDLLCNIALFLPMGVFLVRGGLRRRTALLGALALSVAIESAQSYIYLRNPSLFDVISNTTGALLGAWFAAPLLSFGRRVYVRPLRVFVLVAGAAAALLLAARYPQIARFTLLFPFAVAVLGGLVASGICRPEVAFVLATGGVFVVCTRMWWPVDPLWIATSTAGSALGAWPAERT